APDASGNVYVLGTSKARDSYSLLLVKYHLSGEELWYATYPMASEPSPALLQVAPDGTVDVLAGPFSGFGQPLAHIRLDPAGNTVWTRPFDGFQDGVVGALALDGDGNRYLTGGAGGDALSRKLDPLGAEVWTSRYGAVASGRDTVLDMAL